MIVKTMHWDGDTIIESERFIDVALAGRITIGTLAYDVPSVRRIVKGLQWALARDRYLKARRRTRITKVKTR